MGQDIVLGYAPRDQFVPFHMRTQRWACLVAHRRAGKTVACLMDLLDAALRCDKRDGRFAFISPTYAMAKDAVWLYLKRFTADIPGVEQRESDLMVILPNGARVRLYGSDNYHRLRGIFLDGCILDEYADMAPQAWPEVIRPALSDRRGWAVFIGTPRGRNDFWRIHEHAKQDPTWFSAVLKASETGLLPEEELADLRKMLTPEAFEQELQCSFDAAILGAYYGRDIVALEAAGRVGDVPHDPVLPVHTAWDLGVGDSTAIWFFQVVGGDIHVIDHYEAHGHGLPHYAAVLMARGYTYGRHYVPHDAKARDLGTGRTRVETMRTLLGRWPDVLAQNDVMDGINAARLTLPRCRFDAIRCADGLEALRQYRAEFNDKTKAFTDRPRHDWTSHTADAFRYLAMAWRIIAPAPPPPVPTFEFGISGVPGMPFRTGVSVTELIRRQERRASAED
jgi:phage terminase large subunit